MSPSAVLVHLSSTKSNPIKIGLLIIVGLGGIGGCNIGNSPSITNEPKAPPIKEIMKAAPLPKPIDVKSFTQGTIVRDKSGGYVIPWRELTTCDGPSSCQTVVINEVTKEVAIRAGIVQSPWRETGNGAEISRPSSATLDAKPNTETSQK